MPLLKEANRGPLWRKRNTPCLPPIASHRIALSRDMPRQGPSSLCSLMSENTWPGRKSGSGGTWLGGISGKDRAGRHPMWSRRQWSRLVHSTYLPAALWFTDLRLTPPAFLSIFNYSDLTCWHKLSKLFIISSVSRVYSIPMEPIMLFKLGLISRHELSTKNILCIIWRARGYKYSSYIG